MITEPYDRWGLGGRAHAGRVEVRTPETLVTDAVRRGSRLEQSSAMPVVGGDRETKSFMVALDVEVGVLIGRLARVGTSGVEACSRLSLLCMQAGGCCWGCTCEC